MYNYNKSIFSPYDPTKLAICSVLRLEDDLISNCGPDVKKTVSIDDVVHFIDEGNMMTYGSVVVLRSSLKLLQKSHRSTEKGSTFPDPVENPNVFPATINIRSLLMSRIALISFWSRKISGTCFQQLICHSTTLMTHTRCPISTLNQQLNNLEQTHIQCSFHCERWRVKGRDCESALHSFKEITYRTDDWTKQLPRLRSWDISGSPEQWTEFRPVWWTVDVFKCAIWFNRLISTVCWCIICCF